MGTLDTIVSKEVMLSNKFGNIKIWKSTMKSILIKEDLWDLVNEPPTHAQSSKDKGKTDTSKETSHPIGSNLDKLKKCRQKAKSIIELSIEVDLRVHIEDKNDPKIAWRNLLALFQTNIIANTMLSLNRWENLQIEDHMDIATFFTKVYEIKRELQLAGHPQMVPVIVH